MFGNGNKGSKGETWGGGWGTRGLLLGGITHQPKKGAEAG